jgi:hypothetical protein
VKTEQTGLIAAISRFSDRLDDVRRDLEPRLRGAWGAIGEVALVATGAGQIAAGVIGLAVARDHIPDSPLGVVGLFGGAGLAIFVSGVLTVFRRRRQLVHRLLGALTAGAFALALVFLSRGGADEVADGMLTAALLFGGCLLVTLVFADLIAEEGAA